METIFAEGSRYAATTNLGHSAALLLYTETSAIAQGTDKQREACTPDVFRLCGAYIPDVDRITACLRGNGPRLSRPCYDVFFPPQVVDPRRRSQGRPYPPDYDDD